MEAVKSMICASPFKSVNNDILKAYHIFIHILQYWFKFQTSCDNNKINIPMPDALC
jgi:hypothetical protein